MCAHINFRLQERYMPFSEEIQSFLKTILFEATNRKNNFLEVLDCLNGGNGEFMVKKSRFV